MLLPPQSPLSITDVARANVPGAEVAATAVVVVKFTDLLEHAKRVVATTLTQPTVATTTDTTEENSTAALQNFRPDGYYNRNSPRYDSRWPLQQNPVSYPQPPVQRQPGTSSSHSCHGYGHYSMDNISMSRSFKRVMVSHDGSATTSAVTVNSYRYHRCPLLE
ncbi:unnamed protein product, partial [Didymodactylos carnosus]